MEPQSEITPYGDWLLARLAADHPPSSQIN